MLSSRNATQGEVGNVILSLQLTICTYTVSFRPQYAMPPRSSSKPPLALILAEIETDFKKIIVGSIVPDDSMTTLKMMTGVSSRRWHPPSSPEDRVDGYMAG